jgi:hypothetical protein
VILGTREDWALIAQPPDIAKKSKHQQRRRADSDTDLCASKSHLTKSLSGWQLPARLPPEDATGHVRMGRSETLQEAGSSLDSRPDRNDNICASGQEKRHGLRRALQFSKEMERIAALKACPEQG